MNIHIHNEQSHSILSILLHEDPWKTVLAEKEEKKDIGVHMVMLSLGIRHLEQENQ